MPEYGKQLIDFYQMVLREHEKGCDCCGSGNYCERRAHIVYIGGIIKERVVPALHNFEAASKSFQELSSILNPDLSEIL